MAKNTGPGAEPGAKPRKRSDRMASKGIFNAIDVHVGRRFRQRRTLLGLSQQTLAAMLGLTFQQLQKYEKGSNRISSSRLFDLSRILDVPVSYFFGEMPDAVQAKAPSLVMGIKTPTAVEYEPDPLAKRETLELVRAYYSIPDTSTRKRLAELVKAVARARRGDR